jgi:hypothetical protein
MPSNSLDLMKKLVHSPPSLFHPSKFPGYLLYGKKSSPFRMKFKYFVGFFFPPIDDCVYKSDGKEGIWVLFR